MLQQQCKLVGATAHIGLCVRPRPWRSAGSTYTAAEWREFDQFIVDPDNREQVALVSRMLQVHP
jgi:hypothetical protein